MSEKGQNGAKRGNGRRRGSIAINHLHSGITYEPGVVGSNPAGRGLARRELPYCIALIRRLARRALDASQDGPDEGGMKWF